MNEMRLKLDCVRGGTSYTISKIDREGNGIIVISGKLGGCDFMNEAEVTPRLEALEEMVGIYNEMAEMKERLEKDM